MLVDYYCIATILPLYCNIIVLLLYYNIIVLLLHLHGITIILFYVMHVDIVSNVSYRNMIYSDESKIHHVDTNLDWVLSHLVWNTLHIYYIEIRCQSWVHQSTSHCVSQCIFVEVFYLGPLNSNMNYFNSNCSIFLFSI